MDKRKRIIVIGGIILLIAILCGLLTFCGSNEETKNKNGSTEKSLEQDTTAVGGNAEIEIVTDEEGNTFYEEVTPSKLGVNSDETVDGDITVGMDETSDLDRVESMDDAEGVGKFEGEIETTLANKETSSNSVTDSEEVISSDKTTDSSKTTVSDKSSSANKPADTEETTTKGVEEDTQSSSFRITLTAPQNAFINSDISVSVDAKNCAHIEWYINGEYDRELEKKINPKGNLKFDKAGLYRVRVIGYTEDYKQKVSDVAVILVYKDEAQMNGNSKEHDRAMYSWNHEYIYPEYEALLQQVMELTDCNILYQEVSSSASASDVAAFLERRGEQGQTVYYLCGNAKWAIEKDAASMLREVERAAAYNAAAGEHKFVGIQFDVEPYCLTDFDENAKEYMTQYVKNSKLAYQAAKEKGLLVEICIPYWWDSAYGFDEELEDLIANACDSVAVMNYYKKQKEIDHIEGELELCKKYNKPIVNITETIPPGQHDLTEDNTYYNDGIDAIEEMWNTLDGFFQYEKLGYAFHYMKIIIELLGLK